MRFEVLETTGLPSIIRPSFTLGGTGGGVAYNREEFVEIVRRRPRRQPDHRGADRGSLLGWKEYEMEVVRDRADNAIIICSIENVDPMGVHTGDSITVAPALTLTDKEYQRMRSASIAVLREIGVETGGSNVQFAINPKDGRMIVIEMNPRVSRSSALASKATGFPIAKVAAKLAVGYTLDEIANDITGGATPASFEPTIDYVVTKVPRFAFEKFKGADQLSTAMKSVGEVMAIGRSFAESLQKALRGLEIGLSGLDRVRELEARIRAGDRERAGPADARPAAGRGRGAAPGLHRRADPRDRRLRPLVPRAAGGDRRTPRSRCATKGCRNDAAGMRRLKAMGFSDKRLAQLALRSAHVERQMSEPRRAAPASSTTRSRDDRRRDRRRRCAARLRLGVRPVFKRIDSCAAEFDATTPYLYSTYEAPLFGEPEDEAEISDRRKVVILGGGPNRIGQGIEFDYCCCHACFALEGRRASRRSWSTATRRRCRPTRTPRTGSISSR